MSVKVLRPYLKALWPEIREALESGRDRPSPVRRVDIPKPGGGMLEVGIPTVLDRLLQQAIAQALTPPLEPGFSRNSYGFRPGRSAHDAVRQAQEYVRQGYEWVVDIDGERSPWQRLLARPRVREHRQAIPSVALYLTNRHIRSRMSSGMRGGG